MNKPLSKAERTKNFIIENTAEVFNKKGYAGTSLSDLTNATGLTKGSIYGNFENKEEVALAVFDYNHSKIKDSIQLQIGTATSFQDKLLVYIKVYKNMIRSLADKGGCPILNTAIEADDTNNLLKDRAAKAIIKWEKNISIMIQQGIAAGEFKEQINTRQIALSIIALIEGGIMIAKVTNDPTSMDSVLKTAESMINQLLV